MCCESCDVLECIAAGREIDNYDMEIKTAAGKNLWVNVSLLVAPDGRTGRKLIVHFVRDIQKRKLAEQQTLGILRIAKRLVATADAPSGLPPVSPLTNQERRILGLLAAGKSTSEVARGLQISESTLRNHIFHINRKLHAKNRLGSILQSIKRGLI